MRPYAFGLFFLVALILGLYFEQIAQAIPAGQRDCETGDVSITSNTGSTAFVIVPNTSVTVNNGTTSRNCIIQFSTEVLTSIGDRTNLRYTIDSDNPASCVAIGSDLFHISTLSFFETNTHMGVINIGSGTHTIRPCYQAQDLNNDKSSFSRFVKRCLTVECRTQ